MLRTVPAAIAAPLRAWDARLSAALDGALEAGVEQEHAVVLSAVATRKRRQPLLAIAGADADAEAEVERLKADAKAAAKAAKAKSSKKKK
eukprot:SAG11_NODE_891_length_6685_cov_4.256909_7_plen_90_part_00